VVTRSKRRKRKLSQKKSAEWSGFFTSQSEGKC